MPIKPGQFQKGTSGNPKGRPKNVDTARAVLTKLGGKDGIVYAQQLHDIATLPHKDVKVRIEALKILIAYSWGKPKDSVELEVSGGLNLGIVRRLIVDGPDRDVND